MNIRFEEILRCLLLVLIRHLAEKPSLAETARKENGGFLWTLRDKTAQADQLRR